jgi:hypothetical protein
MAENRTRPTAADVGAFLDAIDHDWRRSDARTMVELMRRVTGAEPVLWGPSIVGFGSHHYRYESGREGDVPAVGFSPRAAATTVYLRGDPLGYADDLAVLGPHSLGKGCLYLKRLGDVDLDVLARLVRRSYDA